MTESEKITAEIAELERQFVSAENCKSGRISLTQYNNQLSTLRERLRDAQRETKQVAPVRPAARPATSNYAQRLDELEELERELIAALDEKNQDAFARIIGSSEYARLLFHRELQRAKQFSGTGFAAAIGARVELMQDYATLGAMKRKALEERVQELENAIPRYLGVHRAGEIYGKGAIVTLGGSMFIALRSTDTKPPSDDWQCCVQRGRDGRKD